mgnify:CR=1 FL=1
MNARPCKGSHMTRGQYADDELGEHALVDVEEQHVVTVFDPPDDIVRWTLRIYLNNNKQQLPLDWID